MKGRGDRPTRVAEKIREEISLILQNKVKDPGIGLVTVTDVSLTPDLKSARVHYSVLGGEDERRTAIEALRRCKGFIRRELGKQLTMRFLPEVAFVYDDSYEKGARMGRLLREISKNEPDAE
jgi:ribosome-binding factor A